MPSLRSNLGRANWKGVWGWALDAADPGARVIVEILVDGEVVAAVAADDPRPGLKMLPDGQRDCGFEFLFSNGLSALFRHVIRARRASDHAELDGSPLVVEADPGFSPALEQTIGFALQAAIAAAEAPDALDDPLRLLMRQIDGLLEVRRALPGGGEPAGPELAALRQRWGGALDALAAGGAQAAARNPDGSRVLVIADPSFAGDLGGHALLAHMRSLVRLGFRVEFAAAGETPDSHPHVAVVEALGAAYCRPPFYPTVESVLLRHRDRFDAVILHGLSNFEMYAALARRYSPRARVVLSIDSLLFLAAARRAALQQWPEPVAQAGSLRLRELTAAWAADAVIVGSEFEAETLRQNVPRARVHAVGWPVHTTWPAWSVADREGVAFLGDYRRDADFDAAAWLVETLMPAVWAINPAINCVLAGSDLPDAVRALRRDGVVLMDDPGLDSSQVFDRVRLSVAPWRCGAGLNGGVVDSLAAGVPCVATVIGAEALALPDELRAWVGADVDELALMICRLHADERANTDCAEAGARFIAEHFSAAAVDRALLEVLDVADAGVVRSAMQAMAAD